MNTIPETAAATVQGDPRRFYDQQFEGDQYSVGIEDRSETEVLRSFVESYGLEDKRVLEIGCGRGAFQHVVRDWVGVDLASSVVSYISKPFVTASAEDLPFADESFDGIWSITVLEHVPAVEQALEEIMRVLRPGGVAFLAPAWHCRPWAANGYTVRPWSDFDWRGKLIKASIPVRNALWFRALQTLPWRVWRAAAYRLSGSSAPRLRYGALEANFEVFWCADSDACNSLDPCELLLWYRSRGWTTPSHRTWSDYMLVRHGAVIVKKPDSTR